MTQIHWDSSWILYEDNHCLVVNKPPRLLTVCDLTSDPNLLDMAKVYLKIQYSKPGKVFLGVVQRLDRPVSGVILFAKTSKAASRLADQFRNRTVNKTYWALVTGSVRGESHFLENYLLKDEVRNLSVVVSKDAAEAKLCRLQASVIGRSDGVTLLKVSPETGRSHQIRVQLAHQDWPIIGDSKYGSAVSGQGLIALHALSLTFEHPTLRTMMTVTAPPPQAWNTWFPNLPETYKTFLKGLSG